MGTREERRSVRMKRTRPTARGESGRCRTSRRADSVERTLVGEPSRFVNVRFGITVVAAEVVVVHISKWDVAIERGLRARGEDEIVLRGGRRRDCFA